MQYVIGVISLFFVLKIFSNRRKHMISSGRIKEAKHPLLKMILSPAGIDMLGRFIKFFLVYVATHMASNSRFMVSQARMVALGTSKTLEKVANFFGAIRIISRYPRTRGLIQDLFKVSNKLKKQLSLSILIEGAFGLIGDLLNVIYFFFDHYMGLFLLGVFDNEQHLIFADFWGNYIWTWSSFFYFLRNLVMIYHYWKPKKQLTEQEEVKLRYFICVDICRNILDTIVNYYYTYPGFFELKTISIMSMIAALLWMTEFWRN